MGRRITVDSATLVNKGLEVIEAHYLFDLDFDRIAVLVHPQSIVHSMVEFSDGSFKAHLGRPDMRIPIAFALTHPSAGPIAGRALRMARTDPDLRRARPRPPSRPWGWDTRPGAAVVRLRPCSMRPTRLR